MSFTENDDFKDYEYFKLRKLDKIYVSKVFPFKSFSGNIPQKSRYIKKVFEKAEDNEFVKVKGEIVLRSSPTGRDQVSVFLVDDGDGKQMSFILQKFRENPKSGLKPIEETSFTFRNTEFKALLKFLSDTKFLNFNDKSRFVVDDKENFDKKIALWLQPPSDEPVLANPNDAQLMSALSGLKGEGREMLLKSIRNKVLTKKDLDILSGRKEGLDTFRTELFKIKQDWNEPKWQSFFNDNSWIFGYGLDYQFLNIIQKEAKVSDIDVDGSNTVISDFLLGNKRFTVLVELKRPDTPLFETAKNRSNNWKLSKELTDAVSQILTQKAEWEFKSQTEQFDSGGNVITEKTYDPKTILIIGNTSQFSGEDREFKIKGKTFELYRRNSRNIEIITFDELFDKASFIVNNEQKIEKPDLENDDLPF
ncbi:MAG: DUF4263 domain-containing protein [Bacteroidetes bacterium]|nr:DUF4263 domain-containing protein [Bacteroidota bacterium]